MNYRAFLGLLFAGVLLSTPLLIIAQDESSVSESDVGLTIHVVQRSENLYRIALQYGVTVAELTELNGLLNANTIYVGQRLLVPTAEAAPTLPETHIVQPGETLNNIASFYNLDLETLVRLNNIINVNQVYVGQVLRLIPETDESTAQTETTPEVDAPTPVPSPTGIASSVDTMETATNTPEVVTNADADTSDDIPTLSSNIHLVTTGETLFRIAQRYGLTVQDLMTENSLSSTVIYAGQRLVIPNVDAPETDIVFPAPINDIEVNPLIFIEGETGSITITTDQSSSVEGRFLERDLRVISTDDNTRHQMLIPIPRYTEADTYPVTLTFINSDSTITEYAFNLRVASGGYGIVNLNVGSPTSQAVTDEELGLLERVTREFTGTKFYDETLGIPAAAAMNSRYGTRRSYNAGTVSSFHSGADFASAPGSPIYASADGVVVLADMLNVRGNTLVLNHGWGVYTLYAHLTEFNVSIGENVESGQIIGTAGSTGRVTGPHLHWEVWLHGVPVNPLQWTQETLP